MRSTFEEIVFRKNVFCKNIKLEENKSKACGGGGAYIYIEKKSSERRSLIALSANSAASLDSSVRSKCGA